MILGALLSPLLAGYEPVGGDADRFNRPVKAELARMFQSGGLPFWSDRYGLGAPLLAESQCGAFYPVNHVLYRLFDVGTAYRLALWAHHVGMAAAMAWYAGRLGLRSAGATLAGVILPLCGYSAIHASHEVHYQVIAWLPLALGMAEWVLAGGGLGASAGLALVLGVQWTVGQFQFAVWTGALVLFTAGWRVLIDGSGLKRGALVVASVLVGMALAAVQLVPTAALVRETKQADGVRGDLDRMYYSYPPRHLAEPAVPRLFRDAGGGPNAAYWHSQQTSGYEAAFYAGTIPLLLAPLGLIGESRRRAIWLVLGILGVVLATMPRWWPEGYILVLRLPGIGLFRAPARFTMLATIALAILGGAGLDRLSDRSSWRIGLGLGVLLGATMLGYAAWWATRPDARGLFRVDPLWSHVLPAAGVWVAAVLLCAVVRVGLPPCVLIAMTAAQLGWLFYTGPIDWGRASRLPTASVVLSRLESTPEVGLVAGALENLPVRAGLATATPYLGFPLWGVNRMLQAVAANPDSLADPAARAWLQRRGVTHAVQFVPADTQFPDLPDGVNLVWEGADPALDRVVNRPEGGSGPLRWRVVSVEGPPNPPAWVATRVQSATDERALWRDLILGTAPPGTAWMSPPDIPEALRGLPPSRTATLERWEGRSGVVSHDGPCLLLANIAADRGWRALVDGQPSPTTSADGGLLAVPLPGKGRREVRLIYAPPDWPAAKALSISALFALAVALAFAGCARRRLASTPPSAAGASAP